VSLTNGVITTTANKIFEISKKYLPNSFKRCLIAYYII
jgi:hypothetical protein